MAATSLPLVSAAISCFFLVVLPVRLRQCHKATVKLIPGRHGIVKLAITTAFALGQVIFLAWTCTLQQTSNLNPILLSFLCSTLASFTTIYLSHVEHWRSLRPSDVLIIYLWGHLVLDAVWVTYPSLPPALDAVPPIALVRLCLELVVLVSECRGKDALLLPQYGDLSPEEKSNVISRAVFWWINPVLVDGYGRVLGLGCLPSLSGEMTSSRLRRVVLGEWEQRYKDSLLLVLVRSLRKPFLGVIVPRLFLVAFRYSQPVLISRAIRYVQSNSLESREDASGYLLILMAIVIYTGLAITTAVYRHGLNRLRVMVRGSLIGLIHGRTLERRNTMGDDTTAVALVSTDVAALENVAQMFHETWGQLAEVLIGTVLLAQRVGWLWCLPFPLIFVTSQASRYVAKHLKHKQAAWNIATQKRLAMTSAMLGSVQSIKMLGMQDATEAHVQNLRAKELDAARPVRWIVVLWVAVANALGIFAPVMTIVIYAFMATSNGSSLDAETAFTTVAILAMVTHPANMVMTILPRAVAAYSSVERIQAYLPSSGRDARRHPEGSAGEESALVSVKDLCVRWDSSRGSGEEALRNVNFDLPGGSVTICSGPVGAGKTTLARVLLGEVVPSAGMLMVGVDRVAYCSQVPWLPNRTIKEAIVGPSEGDDWDEGWYDTVIRGCCLDVDLEALPEGHDKIVGTQGSSLSGGQGQRVALARAVYHRCRFVILDDTFSALDGKTEQQVVMNLLGPEGLLRRQQATVFCITNSEQYFHLADNVILLNKAVLGQGPWDSLSTTTNISKMILQGSRDRRQDAEVQESVKSSDKRGQHGRENDLRRKDGDASLYAYYFSSAGPLNIALMTLCTASYSIFSTTPHYLLKQWTSSPPSQTPFYATIYILLALTAWTLTTGTITSTNLFIAPTSGLRLHNRLLHTVMAAPLSFFSKHDTSITLNHFAEDIRQVDRELPASLHTLAAQVFKLLVQAALLYTVQRNLALTMPFCCLVVYLVQKLYLHTSRQLRLLDLEYRAGVSSSLLETARGIETIRSFCWEDDLAKENVVRLEESQKPMYLLLCLQRWLNAVLDLVIAGVAVGVITSAVMLRGTTTGGEVGVAMNVVLLANGTLLKLVESWTDLEVCLGAVARLRGFEEETEREGETGEGVYEVDAGWPWAGGVEIQAGTGSYGSDVVAFRDVNLRIKAGQVVMLCGRTGSGKSSLLLSLLRLIDLQSGSIVLDGVDISMVDPSLLRRRCFITVTQQHFFLPDVTLRFNLDPSGVLTDETIVNSIGKTGLWKHFRDGRFVHDPQLGNTTDGKRAVLDTVLSAFPALSGGQAQLLSLARAMLQLRAVNEVRGYRDEVPVVVKPIVLLDEITSSLDVKTEERVNDLIEEEFVKTGHTVIMVTHKVGSFGRRLSYGRDIVIWMEDGRVGKIEEAKDLLARLRTEEST